MATDMLILTTPMAWPTVSWPTVSARRARPTVQTMAAETPCNKRPTIRSVSVVPRPRRRVELSRASNPIRSGRRREGVWSARYPHMADRIQSSVGK